MPLFTRENAAEMARRGNLARWSRPHPPAESATTRASIAPDDYPAHRLARVREQLSLVDAAIEKEASKAQPDGQRLNWLAGAQERLAEQERILAGRPLPGSRRPGREPSASGRHRWEPPTFTSPAPAPAPPATDDPAATI